MNMLTCEDRRASVHLLMGLTSRFDCSGGYMTITKEQEDALRASHAAALAVDGNPAAMSTGRALIATIDAACKGGAR